MAQVNEQFIFLVGRPPMAEFLGFVKQMTGACDVRQLSNEWRAANDHLRTLEASEKGIADNPAIVDLDPSLLAEKDKVLADPIFQRSFAAVPFDVKMVPLDALVVYQKFINLDYVAKLKAQLGPSPTQEAIARFCLPYDHPKPEVKQFQQNQNTFVYHSSSLDLRVLDLVMLDQSNIVGYHADGPIAGVVGAVVGYGSNALNAVHMNNRLILNNGSHRAYALRDLGIQTVPCIVQYVTRIDELGVMGLQHVAQAQQMYLSSPRPPILKDYFDPRLVKTIPVQKRQREVKIQIGSSQAEVPG